MSRFLSTPSHSRPVSTVSVGGESTTSRRSGYSIRDALASYRRSQYLSINANVSRTESYYPDDDDESAFGTFEEDDEYTPAPGRHLRELSGATGAWDNPAVVGRLPLPTDAELEASAEIMAAAGNPEPILMGQATETTALLHKKVSFSQDVRPEREYLVGKLRRSSVGSAKSERYETGGRSTFGQTLFNAIAVLMGVGMLSEPLAFARAGWIGGTSLLILYGLLTCYTAKILGRIILSEPHLRSYADIGQKAFGPRSLFWISTMFCLELFAISVALVTLSADSLHSLLPAYSANYYKIWGALVLIPTVFVPLSLLSVTSILGIISTLFIVGVVFTDGLSKREAPGSLWDPAKTSMFPDSANALAVSFGLLMAGFSGHAVIPSLAKDMVDPSRFDEMINWSFGIATTIYVAIGGAGYLMFGQNVHDEVSVDLFNTPGYSKILNTLALITFVISPLSKFALTTRPINITLELMFGLEERLPPTDLHDHAAKPRTLSIHGHPPNAHRLNLRRAGVVVERITFTLLSIAVSICIPEFSAMMAFIGSFSAFLLCLVGPLFAKRSLYGLTKWDNVWLLMGIVMAAWGTVAAFFTTVT